MRRCWRALRRDYGVPTWGCWGWVAINVCIVLVILGTVFFIVSTLGPAPVIRVP